MFKLIFLISQKLPQRLKRKVVYLEYNHQQDLLYFQLALCMEIYLEDNKILTHLVAKLNKNQDHRQLHLLAKLLLKNNKLQHHYSLHLLKTPESTLTKTKITNPNH
jgi:hypothetical protein